MSEHEYTWRGDDRPPEQIFTVIILNGSGEVVALYAEPGYSPAGVMTQLAEDRIQRRRASERAGEAGLDAEEITRRLLHIQGS